VTTSLEAYLRRIEAPDRAAAPGVDLPALAARYRDDPVGFVTDVVGAASATRRSNGAPYQFQILADIAAHPRVIVKSGHGVGKTATVAWATLWWLLTRPYSRVILVAPEFSRQVAAVLFGELRAWTARAKLALPVEVLESRALVDGHREEWAAIGMPATEPGRIEGFHSEAGVLLVLDEMKGIPSAVWDALQGALTSRADNRVLMTSTPGGPEGPFFTTWERGAGWVRHHVAASDSSLVDPRWVEDRRREWGERDPRWTERVLGEFAALTTHNVMFLPAWLDAAERRHRDGNLRQAVEGLPVVVAVDPEHEHDRTAVAITQGGVVDEVRVLDPCGGNTMTIADKLVALGHELADRAKIDPTDQLARGWRTGGSFLIDVVGVGRGVADRLAQLGQLVTDFSGLARPTDATRFHNRRIETAWATRDLLLAGAVGLPPDPGLREELLAQRYVTPANGKILLEPKAAIRDRINRSPDLADVVMMALGSLADAATIGGAVLTI